MTEQSSAPSTSPMSLSHEIRRQAAEWMVKLQSDNVTDETRRNWEQWLTAHPDHQLAWRCIESLGDKVNLLSSPIAHATLAPPESRQRRQAIKTLAVLLFGGGSALVMEKQVPWRQWTADHRTGIGERIHIALADGTSINMNSSSSININFTASERLVHLLSGEIFIVTAPDPLATNDTSARPFFVKTSQGRIQALGTRFNVRKLHEDEHCESLVAVYEGAVDIQPKHGHAKILNANEQTSFTRNIINTVSHADENTTAWIQDIIVVQDMPLTQFLNELNRHRPGYIRCHHSLARLKVTGTYPLIDTDKILAALRYSLPIEIRTITPYLVNVYPRS